MIRFSNIRIDRMRFITLIFIILCSISSMDAQTSHFVTNFAQGSLIKGSQTWKIACYDNDWVFFASRSGMSQYNGDKWTNFRMSNGIDCRSVYASHATGRIYVGGINEFGYYTPDERGIMHYTSLRSKVGNNGLLDNVWGIYEDHGTVYVQGDKKILKITGKENVLINANAKLDCSNLVNGVLYLGSEKGLFVLVGNRVLPAGGAEKLKDVRIRSIAPYKNGIIVFTAYEGVYYYDGLVVTPIRTGCEGYMASNEVFSGAVFGDIMAVGTVQNGLMVYNLVTGETEFYNEENGLQDNTVLSLTFDGRGNLWAGLDSGIDYIWLDLPLLSLSSNRKSLGVGYDAMVGGNLLYLGTNRGLFYTVYPTVHTKPTAEIGFVHNSGGQVWGLERIGEDLFCMHDKGLFQISGTSMKHIEGTLGVWTIQPLSDGSGRVYLGCYDGIYIMQKVGATWQLVGRIVNFYDSVHYMQQLNADDIWIVTSIEGIIRLKINLSNYTVKSKRYYALRDGLPSLDNINISKKDGKLYFTTSDGIYYYDSKKDKILPDRHFSDLMLGRKQYMRLFNEDGRIIGVTSHEYVLGGTKENKAPVVIPYLQGIMEPFRGMERVRKLDNWVYALPNSYGFAFYDSRKDRRIVDEQHKDLDIIKTVYLTYPKDSVIFRSNYLNKKYIPEILYDMNSVRFQYALRGQDGTPYLRYKCRINDGDGWSEYSEGSTKEFTGLKEGKYTFQVVGISADGQSHKDEFTFVILPPIYRTVWAYLIYLIILGLIVRYLIRLEKKRVAKTNAAAVREKDILLLQKEEEFKEENARKERQIMRLEKEKLRDELEHKSQEMADLLMNFARKNEVLILVKEDLQKLFAKIKGKDIMNELSRMVLNINNKIDTNIQSDDLLKRIEEQFDMVHNNFMKRLRATYPSLTTNELLMCAYIKMNLSTKEIAPLLNISVRGVETLRYRLRKKINMEAGENLGEYLNSILINEDNEEVKK